MKEKLSICCLHVYRNPNLFTYVLRLGKSCKDDSGKTYVCENCLHLFDEPNFLSIDEFITICECCAKEKFKNIVK